MPSFNEYDAKRIRMILRDLERTTRGQGKGPALRLERVPGAGAGVVVRGVATRMGMVRLGLEIARRALEAETMTLIDETGLPYGELMVEGNDLNVIEIVLADDPLLQSEPAKAPSALLGLVACVIPGLLIATTFLVGLVTIAWWSWRLLRSSAGG
jgi:hypothetical protein